jgi:hypothetical protein
MDTSIKVTVKEFGQILDFWYDQQVKTGGHVSLYAHSAPGIGKTDTVKDFAKRRGLACLDMMASQMDPVDVRGLPVPKDGRTGWTTPDFFPHDPKSKGILFLDELSNGAPAVQNALLQLTLSRQCGPHRLPDGWIIVAAGNRSLDRAYVHRLSSALTSRFIHLDVEANLEEWTEWAQKHEIAPEVTAFLNWKRGADGLFVAKDLEGQRSFTCPRTWAFASSIIKSGAKDKLLLAMLNGAIGPGAATEFIAYLRSYAEMPKPEDILKNPRGCKIPTDRADVMWALTMSLPHHAKDKAAHRPLVDFCLRLSDDGVEEFAILLARGITKVSPHILLVGEGNDGKHFNQFVKRFKSVLEGIRDI